MVFRYKITSRTDSKTCPPCVREGVGVADGRVDDVQICGLHRCSMNAPTV